MPMYNVLYVLETQVKTDAARPPCRPQIHEVNFIAARGSGSEDLRVAIMNQAVSVGATGDEPKTILLENLRFWRCVVIVIHVNNNRDNCRQNIAMLCKQMSPTCAW